MTQHTFDLQKSTGDPESSKKSLRKVRSYETRKFILIALVLVAIIATVIGLVIHSTLKGEDEVGKGTELPQQMTPDYSDVKSCPSGYTPLILIGMDGFRSDFLERNTTPYLKQLLKRGVSSSVRPVFPISTFPNMYTLATGLYPESHGIIDNFFYDPTLSKTFSLGTSTILDPRWWRGEPIWKTANLQGKKSATYFWVGSEIQGQRPTYYRTFKSGDPYPGRVDTVLEWLSLPADERPDIITLYFDDPDSTAHRNGPGHDKVTAKLRELDDLIRKLMEGLNEKGLRHCANVIITADHGMADTASERRVDLDCYTNVDDLLIYAYTSGRINTEFRRAGSDIIPNTNGKLVSDVMDNLECASNHYKAYTKATMPVRLHYTNNDRIGDIVLGMEEGWHVYGRASDTSTSYIGNHGFDNVYGSMQAVFIAVGPAFKEGVRVEPFDNIELYNLMTDILHITPAPNNGTPGSLHHILKNPPKSSEHTRRHYVQCLPVNAQWSVGQSCDCNQQTADALQDKINKLGDDSLRQLIPTFSADNEEVCILKRNKHITGFSQRLDLPRFVTTILTNQQSVPRFSERPCLVYDNGLSNTIPRDDLQQDIIVGNLLPDNFLSNTCNVSLSANTVPMYSTFKTGIWQYVWEQAHSYTTDDKFVSITTGPIFDFDHDGHADEVFTRFADNAETIPLPSHFYVLMIRCKDTSTLPCDGNVDTLAFILPHIKVVPNCLDFAKYMVDNIVRIRDIELLTGNYFTDDFSTTDAIIIRLRLNQKLWSSNPEIRFDVLNSKRDGRNANASGTTCPTSECNSGYNPVILISLDGFRADYLLKNVTPVIQKLIKNGVHAPYMRPVYPTYTFPNHYTLVTGLYPESHGIVDNRMFDVGYNMDFGIGRPSASDPRWWGGEPIWVTAKRQGKKTASAFWVASDIPVQGELATYVFPYQGGVTFNERIDKVFEWLDMSPADRPEFIALYFNEPDSAGHSKGPDSKEVEVALKKADDAIRYLVDGLKNRNLGNCANLIILADHGMTPRSCDRAVAMNDVLFDDEMSNIYIYTAMFGRISTKYSRSGRTYTVHDPPKVSDSAILDKIQCLSPHMRAYKKEDLPKRHHYVDNARIDNIVMDVDNEWIIVRKRGQSSGCSGASHGEDNIYASEGALFLAHGPAFKSGVTVEPFENIEIYNLLADLLGVTPASNNGTKGRLYNLMRNPPAMNNDTLMVEERCSNPDEDIVSAVRDQCDCTPQDVATDGSFIDVPRQMEDTLESGCRTMFGPSLSSFSSLFSMPRWSTVSLNNRQSGLSLNASACIVGDPNLPEEHRNKYLDYANGSLDISAGHLVPAHTRECSIVLSSSVAPMFNGFRDGIWHYVWTLVDNYLSMHASLQVTSGPIWDYDHNGVYEGMMNNTKTVDEAGSIILPTHYFIIVSKCADGSNNFPCSGAVDLLPFILPHSPRLVTCETQAHHLFENVARLRDIELLTGLRFFTGLPAMEASVLRTFLPTQLWKSVILTPPPINEGSWKAYAASSEGQASRSCPFEYKPLLLISMDGFRGDYLTKYNVTPVLQTLSQRGVHVPFMRASYPTKTFPNHYTMVTGLYPESHGIIDNNMYDADLHLKFSLSGDAKLDPRWWLGETIWETAMKQGKKTASLYWVGSDIDDHTSTYFKRYLDGTIQPREKIDQLMYWMDLPKHKRPEFLTLYFDEPDHTAHEDGPFSPQAMSKLRDVDSVIGYLMDELYARDMHNCVNLIITADHGMANISCDKMLSLSALLSSKDINNVYVYQGPFGRISNEYKYGRDNNIPLATPIVSKDSLLEKLQCKSEHLRAYDKTWLPLRHHYSDSDRIDDIILDTDEEWQVSRTGQVNSYCRGGDHGWDNMYQSMGAVFMGHGPSFKTRHTAPTFQNIELYNLMATILNVTPAPNNGTSGSLHHLLINPPTLTDARPDVTYGICPAVAANSSSADGICECSLSTVPQVDTSSMIIPVHSSSSNSCLIQHHNYVTIFGTTINMPLFTSVAVSKDSVTTLADASANSTCVIPDQMLGDEYKSTYLQYYNDIDSIVPGSLIYGQQNNCTNGYVASSSVVAPMHDGFLKGIWESLWKRISNYAETYESLTVTTGPIFKAHVSRSKNFVDINETIPLPSHFFVVIARCDNGSSFPCPKELELLSFVLPHLPESPNCLSDEKLLLENVARVRDIELLTGLTILPDIPLVDYLRHVTFLPTSLWNV